MKKTFLMLLGIICLSVSAQDRISMAVHESREIQLPFAVQSYKATPQERVKIESVSDNKLLITGMTQGDCELIISGGSISKKVAIQVVSNLKTVLKKLKSDLQELSELDIFVNQDAITIRGNLSKYDQWKYLTDVLKSYDKKVVFSYVKFVPTAETLINLKKTLETIGYKFSEKETDEPGLLFIKMSPELFVLSGKVFSQGEKDEIMNILSSQAWLDLNSKGTASDGKIKGMVNISIVKTQVVVDIAFIALSKNDVDTLGNQGGVPTAKFDFGILYDIVSGATDKTAKIGANLAQTISFLSESGVTRTYKAGSVSFTNGTNEGYLKIGGTQYVKVRGRDDGDLKEINYGFIVTIKGEIINRRQIRLNINLEYSHLADELKKEESAIRTERIVEFDKTAIIGGYRDITRTIGNEGMPVLRNTPVVQWFVAQRKDSEMNSDLLILVSPRISNDTEVEIPVNRNPGKMVRESQQTNAEYKKNQKKYSGWLYWLNWFVW